MTFNKKEQEEDSYLWSLFVKGNKEAFKRIYEKYTRNLFISGLQFSKDYEIIEDCIHDLFLYFFTNRSKLKNVANLKLYLFVSFRNRLYQALNKSQKITLSSDVELSENPAYTNELSPEPSPESNLIEKEKNLYNEIMLKRLLEQLTDRQREAIHYRFYESMTIAEIAEVMGMNPQSVQNLLQRAISMLKNINPRV